MARFYTLTDDQMKVYRTKVTPGLLYVGPIADLDPTAIGGSTVLVGLTDRDIELNPNIETIDVTHNQLLGGPSGIFETGWAYAITTSLDQIDPWNMALAFSYDVTETVGSSSILTLDAQSPSPYRSAKLEIEGTLEAEGSTQGTMTIEIYKAKVFATGGMPISPDAKSTLPITIRAVTTGLDIVGRIYNHILITSPAYE